MELTINVKDENCLFLRLTKRLHAEFGKLDNFIWKMADLKQIGNTDESRKTMVFETSMPLIS